jgi:hypothetical protein
MKCIQFLQAPEADQTQRALSQLHRFIHDARNRAVREFAKAGRSVTAAAEGRGAFDPDLSSYLEEVVGLYKDLLAEITGSPQGLWVALRRLNPDGNYVTILRKGDVDDTARARDSEPVSASKGLPRQLEDDLNHSAKATRGVVFITPNSKRKATKWKEMKNDCRREDAYVMAAPITIRKCDPDGKLEREMAMILFANHRKDVFRKWHCDIVRCCVDTVSTAFSVAFQMVGPLLTSTRIDTAKALQPVTSATPALVGYPTHAQVSSVNTDSGSISAGSSNHGEEPANASRPGE